MREQGAVAIIQHRQFESLCLFDHLHAPRRVRATSGDTFANTSPEELAA